MRLFICGATGFIGKEVLRRALSAGHVCRCLVRPGSENRLVEKDNRVEIVSGSLPGRKSPYHYLEGCDVIVNLVGIIRERRRRGETFFRIHYEVTHTLVEAAVKRGIRHFILISANGVDSSSNIPYLRTKALAEQCVMESGLSYTILRPSIVYGPPEGRMEFFSTLMKRFFGLFAPPFLPNFDGGTFSFTPVSVFELAEGIVNAVSNPVAKNKIYHVGGKRVITWKEILELLREIRGIYKPIVYFPSWSLAVAALLMQYTGVGPITYDQLRLLVAGNVCDGGAFYSDLGVPPREFDPETLGYLRHL